MAVFICLFSYYNILMPVVLFDHYAALFAKHGITLYMVGGSARDYLLGLEVRDFDFVSKATPEQTLSILGEGDDTFARFGTISLRKNGTPIDFMTFREEGDYGDSRHPSYIKFVEDIELDSNRRDFTINALYIDPEYKVFDFHGGLTDLKNKVIRFIGDPEKRIKEDPLRILRAKRFSKRLGFAIDPESKRAMDELMPLLEKLNPEKVMMESKKE